MRNFLKDCHNALLSLKRMSHKNRIVPTPCERDSSYKSYYEHILPQPMEEGVTVSPKIIEQVEASLVGQGVTRLVDINMADVYAISSFYEDVDVTITTYRCGGVSVVNERDGKTLLDTRNVR